VPFAANEVSVESGRPVELYIFSFQGGTFRYTSAGDIIEYDSNSYLPVTGLSRSGIEDTGEISKSSLDLIAPEDFYIASLFEVYPPSDVVELEILRLHRDDLTDAKTFWLGRVINAEWRVGSASLACESLFTQMRQPGLRRAYSRSCPHLLYGADCRASQLSFVESLTAEAIDASGFVITSGIAGTFPAGYFAGGKINLEISPGVIERRGIRTHVGDLLTMTHPISAMVPGDIFSAWPGCNKTREVCVGRFNNILNYGGFPYIPRKNPFSGSSVYNAD
jgi:uncharacterized phage protein (TIGR02218 family)